MYGYTGPDEDALEPLGMRAALAKLHAKNIDPVKFAQALREVIQEMAGEDEEEEARAKAKPEARNKPGAWPEVAN